MHRITATTRIAMCITLLSLSVLLTAKLMGLMPAPKPAILEGRAALCEAIAIHSSYLASQHNTEGLEESMRAFVDRNADMLSAALRRDDGTLVMEIGDHAANWQADANGRSTDSQVLVPIMSGRESWGTVEVRFEPLIDPGWKGAFQSAQIQLFLFALSAGGLVNLFYLRRVLQHLDPSRVVPNRVRNALDTLAEGLLLLDKDERIVMANEAFAQVVDLSDSELMGQLASNLAWRKDEFGHEIDTFPWTKAAREGAPQSETLFYKDPDQDQHLIFKVNAVPVLGEDGTSRGVVACFDDVTLLHDKMDELGHLRQELVDTAREAGMAEIATDVLHNVGNVLNSVNVSVTMLSQSMKDSRVSYLHDLSHLLSEHRNDLGEFLTSDEKGKKIPDFLCKLAEQTKQEQSANLEEITTLSDCVEHIKEIVRMQQTYAKASAVLEQCDPNAMMDDALRFANLDVEKYGIEVIRKYDELPEIPVAKGKLLQALVNLIRNAKDALIDQTGKNKTITLRTGRSDPNRIQFEVSDNGIGISQEDLTKIFSHGFTTKPTGHGFGLHGSALAVKEMGGELRVESSGVGKGAKFVVDLPIPENALVA